jgi:hypothetical protein
VLFQTSWQVVGDADVQHHPLPVGEDINPKIVVLLHKWGWNNERIVQKYSKKLLFNNVFIVFKCVIVEMGVLWADGFLLNDKVAYTVGCSVGWTGSS